jgi:hypothetical protein
MGTKTFVELSGVYVYTWASFLEVLIAALKLVPLRHE